MRDRGFTMIEIVIVSFLVMLFALTTAVAFRYFNPAIYALRDRTRAVTELRVALEFLRQDLSGAETVEPLESGGLRIERREEVADLAGAWKGGKDKGIEYELDGGRLVRTQTNPDREIVVALDLTEFLVYEPDDEETRIRLAAGTDLGARSITLVWSDDG